MLGKVCAVGSERPRHKYEHEAQASKFPFCVLTVVQLAVLKTKR